MFHLYRIAVRSWTLQHLAIAVNLAAPALQEKASHRVAILTYVADEFPTLEHWALCPLDRTAIRLVLETVGASLHGISPLGGELRVVSFPAFRCAASDPNSCTRLTDRITIA